MVSLVYITSLCLTFWSRLHLTFYKSVMRFYAFIIVVQVLITLWLTFPYYIDPLILVYDWLLRAICEWVFWALILGSVNWLAAPKINAHVVQSLKFLLWENFFPAWAICGFHKVWTQNLPKMNHIVTCYCHSLLKFLVSKLSY